MASFVISKRPSGDYKFVFTSRRGKTIFTSKGYENFNFCNQAIENMRESVEVLQFDKHKTTSGKYYFKVFVNEILLASSRRYTTELRVLKGIDEVKRDLLKAEVLDFSTQTFVFPDIEF